jgi:hypothetical protein
MEIATTNPPRIAERGKKESQGEMISTSQRDFLLLCMGTPEAHASIAVLLFSLMPLFSDDPLAMSK